MNETHLLKTDIRRMLCSPMLYASLCVGVLVLLHPLFDAFIHPANGTLMQFLSVPLGTSDFTPFAAIFCVLPFSDSFCKDYNSGYLGLIVFRTGVKKFALQRCFTVILSGGCLMAVTMFITIVVCIGLANQPETAETTQFLSRTIWARLGLVLKYRGIIHMVLRVLLAFIFGALWAIIGLTISVFITNRYVTYIAPFVLYQALWFLLEGSAFNPVYMLRGDSNYLPSLWFVLTYQLASIALCCTISYFGIRKKVQI
jgi:hypothetical protein